MARSPRTTRRGRRNRRAGGGPSAVDAAPVHALAARREALALIGLWLLAALAAVLFLLSNRDRGYPFSLFYYGDSRVYREYALALLAGRPYDAGLPFHPPLFAWVMASLIEVVGERPTLIRGLLAAGSALTAPLTYLLGLRLADRASAGVAALASAFSFGLLVTAVSANSETVYIPLLVAQALALVATGDALAAGHDRRGLALAAAGGLLLGLGALTRAEHLGFALLLPVALLLGWRRAGGRRLLAASALMVAVAAAAIAPWALRNQRAIELFNRLHPALAEPLPTFVPVTAYGALNFALAHHPAADGTFDPRPVVGARGGAIDLTDPRHLDLYLHGYRRGLRWIAADPAAALARAGRKLALAGDALALGFGGGNRPAGLRGVRRPVDLFVPRRKALLPVALALALAGAWHARRRWRRGAVLWLAIAYKLALCAIFFGYARLLVQVAPFLFLLQAEAVVAAARRLPRRARRALAAAAAALALAFLAGLVVTAGRPRDYRVSGSADARGRILQDARVEIAPLPSGVVP